VGWLGGIVGYISAVEQSSGVMDCHLEAVVTVKVIAFDD
jgi:hypothetical protein